MTTIAYKDGVVAADTLVTCGSMRDGYTQKIHKVADGVLAYSGSAVFGQRFIDWYQGGKRGDCPLHGLDEKRQTNAALFRPDGTIRVWSDVGHWDFRPHEGLYALGSGCEYATGAMVMGATAPEAVRLAMRFDTASGGDITVLEV